MNPTITAVLRRVRRAVSWHRRLLAAGLAAAAVASALAALQPAAPHRVRVLVAAHDLPGGARLDHGDITTLGLPPDAVPTGALRPGARLAGRLVAGAMRAGEPFTDVRLAGAPLLADGRLVAAPVRLADPGVARLLHAGDIVDVIATPTREVASVRVIAPSVRVIAVPGAPAGPRLGGASADSGALVLLATTPEQATTLAEAAVDTHLSVALRPG